MNAAVPATAAAYVEPVVKRVRARTTPARAFAVFTSQMGRWWLPGHSILPAGVAQVDVIVEPRVGGRWYERGADGSECDWGHVIAWEPPQRVVLAWQLDAQWRHDASLVTEVDVRFAADGDATMITLEHRLLERLGAAAGKIRPALDGEGGWSGLLAGFVEALSS